MAADPRRRRRRRRGAGPAGREPAGLAGGPAGRRGQPARTRTRQPRGPHRRGCGAAGRVCVPRGGPRRRSGVVPGRARGRPLDPALAVGRWLSRRRGPPTRAPTRTVGPRRGAPGGGSAVEALARSAVGRGGRGPDRPWSPRGRHGEPRGGRAVRGGGGRRARRRGPLRAPGPRGPRSARRRGRPRAERRHGGRAPGHGVRDAVRVPLRAGVPGAVGTSGRPRPPPGDLVR